MRASPECETLIAPQSHRNLSGYQIGMPIKKGACGYVYRCRCIDSSGKPQGPLYAAKFFNNSGDPTGELRRRFVDEFGILKGINHPNLPRMIELCRDGDALFFVMELIDGVDLEELLRDGPLSLEDGLAIAHQCCQGLNALHQRGIIHRDLKPANIMVKRTPSGELLVCIVDCGLSKAVGKNEQATRVGAFVGSPAYSPPEAFFGMPLDLRADQWSLAATLYRMFSGRSLHGRSGFAQILEAMTDRRPFPSLCVVCPEIPIQVGATISRALNYDRELRYPSILAMNQALQGMPHTLALDLSDLSDLRELDKGTAPTTIAVRRPPTLPPPLVPAAPVPPPPLPPPALELPATSQTTPERVRRLLPIGIQALALTLLSGILVVVGFHRSQLPAQAKTDVKRSQVEPIVNKELIAAPVPKCPEVKQPKDAPPKSRVVKRMVSPKKPSVYLPPF